MGEGKEEKEGRAEEGREKWERKKRDEKVGTFFAAPLAGIFCAFLAYTWAEWFTCDYTLDTLAVHFCISVHTV